MINRRTMQVHTFKSVLIVQYAQKSNSQKIEWSYVNKRVHEEIINSGTPCLKKRGLYVPQFLNY